MELFKVEHLLDCRQGRSGKQVGFSVRRVVTSIPSRSIELNILRTRHEAADGRAELWSSLQGAGYALQARGEKEDKAEQQRAQGDGRKRRPLCCC